jgi:hypothetical protein
MQWGPPMWGREFDPWILLSRNFSRKKVRVRGGNVTQQKVRRVQEKKIVDLKLKGTIGLILAKVSAMQTLLHPTSRRW